MRLTRSQLGDLLAALALALIGVAGTAGTDGFSEADRALEAPAFVLVALCGLVLAVRRRWPLATLAVTTGLTSAYLVLAYPYGPILLSFFVAVYTVARHLPLRRAAPAAAAALVVLLIHLFTNDAALSGVLGLVPGSAWVVVPFAIGVIVRLNREAAERARAEAVRRGVYEERLGFAQEVHDIVGHGLAAIKMQADIALHLLTKKPEQAEIALSAISRTSSEALDELRAALAVVRRSEPDTARAPAAGLHRVRQLRDRMHDAGLTVRVDTTGTARDLPAEADLVAYRVLQESLTNVLRHGGTKVADVRIDYHTDSVTITISNPLPAPPPSADGGAGLGIPGMRARVTALGGQFTAAPTFDERFEVRADIPAGEHR
jgi:signal transduction histidine kinase